MRTLIYNDTDELSRAYAGWFMQKTKDILLRKESVTVALSGGSTPKKLFRLLATEPYKSGIQWNRIHFFWGDERFVPFDDEKNNARMAFDELLNKVAVVKEQIHIMDTALDPDESVKHYEEILHRYFNEGTGFDVVMLGLGDNAHTLSLFPGYPIVQENGKWVTAFFLREQDMFRISLTKVLVNWSATITYLVAGADKASSVKAVIEGPANADLYPAQVINNSPNDLLWFLDKPAAADLDKNDAS